MQWESYFTKRDLQKGKLLNETESVSEIAFIDSKLKAKVEDKDTYNIEVTVKDSGIETDYTCHCDRFRLSGRCPHIVAALYNWFEEYNTNRDSYPGSSLSNPYPEDKSVDRGNYISDVVSGSQNQQKDLFLSEVLKHDKKLLADFLMYAKDEISDEDLFLVSDYIENLIMDYAAQKYHWKKEDKLARELEEIYNLIIKPLFDKGYIMEAFKLTTYLYDIIDELNMDERRESVRSIENTILSLWKEMFEVAPNESKREILDWLASKFSIARDTILGNFTRVAFSEEFDEEEFVKPKLDAIIHLLGEGGENATYSYGYNLESLLDRFFNIALKSENAESQVEELVQNYKDNLEVKRAYYNFLMKKGNLGKASELIEEILEQSEDKPFLKEYYLKERKDLFTKLDNRDEEVETLKKLALDYDTDSFEYAYELREMLPEGEWSELKQQLVEKYRGNVREESFLEFVGDNKEMIDYTLRANDFKSFIKHFDALFEEYPAEALDAYAVFLKELVRNGYMRKTYQEAIDHLEKIIKLEGGEEIVRDLIDTWERTYEKRVALLDELDKFKIRNYKK